MIQTITIAGFTGTYGGINAPWLAQMEAINHLNKETQASMDYVGTCQGAGTMTPGRSYDADTKTLTITRTWGDDAWTGYLDHADNTASVIAAMEAAGLTVTNNNAAG